ncbi:MAG: S53 family peptidase [Candidatus Tyrphobacter sp.]
MHRYPSILAVAMLALVAACSGHSTSLVPSGQSAMTQNTAGAGTTRAMTVAIAAPSGWAATGTHAIQLSGASELGALPSTQSLTIRVGLQLNNAAALKSLVASGQTISNATFVSTYAPTQAQVSKVTSYLQSKGLTNVSVEPNDLIVSATGTAGQVESAFDTKLEQFSLGGANVYANTAAAYVPSSLAGVVVAVLGLNDAQIARVNPHHGPPQPRTEPTPPGTPEQPCTMYGLEVLGAPTPLPEPASSEVGCLRNYKPADYWRAYDATTAPTANRINIAIMTAGALATAVGDLRTNEESDGIPQANVIVKQVGLAGAEITDGPDEWTLDMTASSGMAGRVHTIYVYNATSLDDSDIVLMWNRWVSDDLAPIGNSSFGECEAFPYVDGAMLLADEIFVEGAAQGQTMFASSGDTGSFCPVEVGENGVPAGAPMVNWPAASPYVTAVGGTTLLTDNAGAYQGEAAWYSGSGGISQFEASPSWESTQPLSGSFRGVPDIAMDGDLQTGMDLYLSDQSGWTVIGGTSLASPLAAGTWARILEEHRNLGFAPPVLYANFTSHTAGTRQTGPPAWQPDGGFHDILIGADGLYTALPGYDYTTGLGSFDVGTLESEL